MTGEVICLDGGLFPEPERDIPPPDERTPGQRRRDRQLAALRRGQHPLSLALGPLPLHPQARRDDDRTDDGTPRCGGCRHRAQHNPGHARPYPKCRFGDGRRITNGEGSDVASWFPACTSYEPTEATR